jgi:hypothetical protein
MNFVDLPKLEKVLNVELSKANSQRSKKPVLLTTNIF